MYIMNNSDYYELCKYNLKRDQDIDSLRNVNFQRLGKYYITYLKYATKYVNVFDDVVTTESVDYKVYCDLFLKALINKTSSFCDVRLSFFKEKDFEKICLEAMKTDISILGDINNQTDEICLKALKISKDALKYIKNPSYDMYFQTISNDDCGEYIKYGCPSRLNCSAK